MAELKPSPTPDTAERPGAPAPRHDTRDDLKAVVVDHKKAKSRRPWWLALVGTLLTGGAGTGVGGMVIADDTKEKSAKEQGAMKQKLDDHITVERDVRLETKKKLETLDKRTSRQSRKQDRMELLLELELDQHRVPKSKRPPREERSEDDEP